MQAPIPRRLTSFLLRSAVIHEMPLEITTAHNLSGPTCYRARLANQLTLERGKLHTVRKLIQREPSPCLVRVHTGHAAAMNVQPAK